LYFVPCNVRSKAEKLCEVYTTMMDNLASFAGFWKKLLLLFVLDN